MKRICYVCLKNESTKLSTLCKECQEARVRGRGQKKVDFISYECIKCGKQETKKIKFLDAVCECGSIHLKRI